METKKSKKGIVALIIIGILIVASIALVIYRAGTRRSVNGIPDPAQTQHLDDTAFRIDDYNIVITYLYDYDIEGLVVSTKDYISFDIGDKLSQRDFGLAWGAVAEYNGLIDFHWSQSGRFLYHKIDSGAEIDKVGGAAYFNEHSSNNHIIPANDDVKWKMWLVRKGDHIRMKGYLVNVDGAKMNGSGTLTWHSSTNRTDTGDGACEVVYVTSIEWLD